MTFYRSNALLEKLSKVDTFFVPKEESWQLIYSDKNYNPILQLNVAVGDESKISNFPRLFENDGGNLVVTGPDSFELQWWHKGNYECFNGKSLYDEYFKRSLVIESGITVKPFNKYSSSYYHDWQSKQKFTGGVTDVDALRLDNNGKVIEIMEIKRSRIPVKRWRPYSADRGGYEILSNLAELIGCKFTTIYYHFDPSISIENTDDLLFLDVKKNFNFTFLKFGNIENLIKFEY